METKSDARSEADRAKWSADDTRVDPAAVARQRAAGPLPPGGVLASRFRIVRFLARGGMGDVYEAEDLELGGRLAVKTIRPAIATDEKTMARFRREVQLARRVTHPNVSRAFAVVHHRGDDQAP